MLLLLLLLLQPQLLVVLILSATAVGGAAGAGGAAPVGRVLPVSPVAVVGLLVEEGPQLADAPVDLALDDRVAPASAAVLGRPPPGGGDGGGGGHAGGHAVRRLQLPSRRRGSHLNIDSVVGKGTIGCHLLLLQPNVIGG